MTAKKPMEPRRVTGQLAARYPLNMFCAHPECPEVADDAHHIFPRSQIGNDFWFVQAWDTDDQEMFSSPLAHVTGLCRSHHDTIEAREAWIQLDEGTLEFVWYDAGDAKDEWVKVGALDPQPGGRAKHSKPKRKRFVTDEELAKRRSVSIKLPVGIDGVYWRDLLVEAEQIELAQEDTPVDRSLGKIGAGRLLITVLERYTGRAAA